MIKSAIKNNWARLLCTACLALACLPVIWVLWFMLSGALMPLDELRYAAGAVLSGTGERTVWPLLPSWPTLAPLTELLLDSPEFYSMFWNSFKIVIPSLAGQLLIATPCAWALSRLRFKGRGVAFALYTILMLMPFQVTMVPNYLVMKNLNLLDTHWAVILPFCFSAFPVFIMAKSFDSVPRALLEAGSIDGANPIGIFLRIGLPLGLPGILGAMVLGFLECWSAIEQPMIFLENPALHPLSLFLPQIAGEKLGLAMSASFIMLLPASLIFLFGQKYLELGIQASGLKQ